MRKKIALVTGASRGIGQAIALALGQQGMIVVGTATTSSGAEKITEMLQTHQIEGMGLPLDICDEDKVAETLQQIKQQLGVVSVLVNNAGITRDNILLRMKPDQWSEVIETNLTGVYRLTKLVLRTMLKARYGRVINISSVVGVMGNPGQANYVAAKAGLIGFTKSLAIEMAAYGITANVVAPGFIATDMTNCLNEEQKKAILDRIPMKKMGAPEDIAEAVVFLAGNKSSYITGQTLHVNGGMCMV